MESVFGVGLIVGIKTIDKGLSYGDQNIEESLEEVEISKDEVDVQEINEEIVLQEEMMVKIFTKSCNICKQISLKRIAS